MSRRKKYRADGGFVMVARQLTRSAAYRSLTPRAGWLLHALMDLYTGEDNRVALSTRDAAAWLKSGLHQATAAFEELADKGLIRLHQRGGFTRKVRHATLWTLTMYGRNGAKATLDFLSWQPGDSVSKNKTRLPGRQQYGCQDGNNDAPTVAGAATVEAIHGCQDGNNTDAGAATLIEYTIQSGAALNGAVEGVWAREQTPSARSAGMVWRKPTYIELSKKRAPRNSGSAWPAAERKRLGLSQPEFARRAGIRREYLSTIEQGRRTPSADVRARIEAALNGGEHD